MSDEKWIKAPQTVLDLAQELIEEYHEHLLSAKIGFIFRDFAELQNGKRILGKASKISAKDKVYSELDFLIWLASDYWLVEANEQQRRALLDHELCHCMFDEETGTWKLRPHDFEEFREIVKRYGLWSPDLMQAGSVLAKATQIFLPGFEVMQHAEELRRLGGELVAVEPDMLLRKV
jgi:hypothetical protein